MIKLKYILQIGATSLVLSACSCSNTTDKAKSCGEQCAQEILEVLPISDMQLQEMLLDVRAKEYMYRSNGDDNAADVYVKAFTEYIILHNDSLAEEIGINR